MTTQVGGCGSPIIIVILALSNLTSTEGMDATLMMEIHWVDTVMEWENHPAHCRQMMSTIVMLAQLRVYVRWVRLILKHSTTILNVLRTAEELVVSGRIRQGVDCVGEMMTPINHLTPRISGVYRIPPIYLLRHSVSPIVIVIVVSHVSQGCALPVHAHSHLTVVKHLSGTASPVTVGGSVANSTQTVQIQVPTVKIRYVDSILNQW
jgi:hypothetical protein